MGLKLRVGVEHEPIQKQMILEKEETRHQYHAMLYHQFRNQKISRQIQYTRASQMQRDGKRSNLAESKKKSIQQPRAPEQNVHLQANGQTYPISSSNLYGEKHYQEIIHIRNPWGPASSRMARLA